MHNNTAERQAWWTQERIDAMRSMFEQGMTARAIAETFGNGLTRNSILGKAHRLGIQSVRANPKKANHRTERAKNDNVPGVLPKMKKARPWESGAVRAERHGGVRHSALAITEPSTRLVDRMLADEPAIPVSQRVTFNELGPRHCRWIIGAVDGPETVYCGGEKTVRAYCAHHASIAYTPWRNGSSQKAYR